MAVPAVVIHQMVGLNPLHGPDLFSGQPAGPVWRDRGLAAPKGCIGGATTGFEVGVTGHKWLVPIVGFILAIFGGPRRGIPYRTINPHWPKRKGRITLPCVPPYRNIIHKESAKGNYNTTICELNRLMPTYSHPY